MTLRIPPLLAGLILAASLNVSAALAGSHVAKVGNLEISDAWIRATPPGVKNGGGYLTVTNHGMAADKLVSASADISKTVELHNHIMDEGVMRMRQVPHIEVPMHASVSLKPGGYHVMFMGLKNQLKEGDMVMLTLHFAEAGDVMVHAPVKRGRGGMMKKHQHQHQNQMKKKMKQTQ